MNATRRDELTVHDAAQLLGVDGRTVRRWCRDRLLAARHDGWHWFPKLGAVATLAAHRGRVRKLLAKQAVRS